MTLFECIVAVFVITMLCVGSYTSGVFINEFINEPHGGMVVLLICTVATTLLFGYATLDIIKLVKGRM